MELPNKESGLMIKNYALKLLIVVIYIKMILFSWEDVLMVSLKEKEILEEEI